jgi:CO/xanthine dehydrogenase FAD-binding subunit
MRSYIADYDLINTPTLQQALERLGSGDGWRPIAGGTDLMVLLNAGKLPFRHLVSVRAIPELRQIIASDTQVSIGAAVTYSEIRRSELLQSHFPLLCKSASWTGSIANQNRGTVGGNIANASPAADSSPVLLAYDAKIAIASSRGVRTVPYRAFHTGYKQMQMEADELLTAIRLPIPSAGVRHYSRKVGTRKAQAISKVSFAAVAELEQGTITDLRIALGSVAPYPLRCSKTEEVIRHAAITRALVAEAQNVLLSEIQPISDIRSTHSYRARVSANLLREFLEGLV